MIKDIKNIKNMMIAAIAAFIILSLPVYAAGTPDSNNTNNPSTHDITQGDDLETCILDVADLSSSEENNCQLTISADLPEHFDANIYALIQNNKTESIFQYTHYAVNGHSQRGYVPEGTYRVLECGVYNDINAAFPLTPIEDFTLKQGDVKTIYVSLENPQSAMDTISERYPESDKLNKNENNTKYRFTTIDHYDTVNGVADKSGNNRTLFISICAIALIFSAGAFALLYYFKKQMIPHEVYTIHEYKPFHDKK